MRNRTDRLVDKLFRVLCGVNVVGIAYIVCKLEGDPGYPLWKGALAFGFLALAAVCARLGKRPQRRKSR